MAMCGLENPLTVKQRNKSTKLKVPDALLFKFSIIYILSMFTYDYMVL